MSQNNIIPNHMDIYWHDYTGHVKNKFRSPENALDFQRNSKRLVNYNQHQHDTTRRAGCQGLFVQCRAFQTISSP